MDLTNNKSNKAICNAIADINKSTLKCLDSEDIFNTKPILSRVDTLTTGIISNLNSKRVSKIIENGYKDNSLSWTLRPKRNSVLSAIDFNSTTEAMKKIGLNAHSSQVIDVLYHRIKNEVTTYKSEYLKFTKIYSNKVKAYGRSFDKDEQIENLFKLEFFNLTPLYNVIKEKDYLENHSLPEVEHINFDLNTIDFISGKLNDLEIELLRETIIKENTDKKAIYEEISDFTMRVHTIKELHEELEEYTLLNLNSLVYIVIGLTEKFNETNDNIYGLILNIINEKINELYKKYQLNLNIDNLVIAFEEKPNESIILTVMEEIYLKNDIKTKSLYGSFLKRVNRGLYNLTVPCIIKLDSVINENEENIQYYNTFIKSLIIENRNNINKKLVNSYIYALNLFEDEDYIYSISDDITKYLNDLELSEIIKYEEVCLDISKKFIYKDSNFNLFITALQDAQYFFKESELDVCASYAVLVLLTNYLYSQTEIV